MSTSLQYVSVRWGQMEVQMASRVPQQKHRQQPQCRVLLPSVGADDEGSLHQAICGVLSAIWDASMVTQNGQQHPRYTNMKQFIHAFDARFHLVTDGAHTQHLSGFSVIRDIILTRQSSNHGDATPRCVADITVSQLLDGNESRCDETLTTRINSTSLVEGSELHHNSSSRNNSMLQNRSEGASFSINTISSSAPTAGQRADDGGKNHGGSHESYDDGDNDENDKKPLTLAERFNGLEMMERHSTDLAMERTYLNLCRTIMNGLRRLTGIYKWHSTGHGLSAPVFVHRGAVGLIAACPIAVSLFAIMIYRTYKQRAPALPNPEVPFGVKVVPFFLLAASTYVITQMFFTWWNCFELYTLYNIEIQEHINETTVKKGSAPHL